MAHACRAAMKSLKKTGTDFISAQGMDPKKFFEVMGKSQLVLMTTHGSNVLFSQGLNEIIELDAAAGGSAFQLV